MPRGVRKLLRVHVTRQTAQVQEAKVIALRVKGLSMVEIGTELDMSPSLASRYMRSALAKIEKQAVADTIEFHRINLLRLEKAVNAIWKRVEKGDLFAVDRLIALSRRESELLGLDKPIKIAPTDPSGDKAYGALSDEERANRITALLERARAERARVIDGGPATLALSAGSPDDGVDEPG